MSRYVSGKATTQARVRRSSTVKAPRRPQKGACLDPQGYDVGKRVMGRKRYVLVETLGLLLSFAVHLANIQDCDGTSPVLTKVTRAQAHSLAHFR